MVAAGLVDLSACDVFGSPWPWPERLVDDRPTKEGEQRHAERKRQEINNTDPTQTLSNHVYMLLVVPTLFYPTPTTRRYPSRNSAGTASRRGKPARAPGALNFWEATKLARLSVCGTEKPWMRP